MERDTETMNLKITTTKSRQILGFCAFMLRARQLRGDWCRIVRLTVGAILVAGLAVMAMPAVAFGQSISYSHQESIYSTGEVGYAADRRDLRVVVHGNPFSSQGVSDEQLAMAVVDSMRGTPGWFTANYTTTPNETARGLYRVVWRIGVAKNASIYAICRDVPGDTSGDGDIGGASSGRTVLAALCRRERIMSKLSGTLGNIASVDDPQFKDFIKVATRQLLPRRNPNRSGGRSNRRHF